MCLLLFISSLQKYKRRTQICATMIEHSRRTSNNDSLVYWSQVMEDLVHLTVAGMSDDEEVHGQQTLVHSPSFRSPLYDELFDKVDNTPIREPTIFEISRSRSPRTRSSQTVDRPPPANLPAIYFRTNRDSQSK